MGILRASTAWVEDRVNGTASWEEIWNLTVFYMRTGRPGEALDILRHRSGENDCSFLSPPFCSLLQRSDS